MELDLIEKQLLNEIQLNVPLAGRPFRDIGMKVTLDEDEVIRRVLYLKESGFLREVRAIIDWRSLGFQSTLVGMEISPEQLEKAADIINKQAGISHNYARNHHYNLWFTLTVPPGTEIVNVIEQLAAKVEAKATLNLPAVRFFKIYAFFNMVDNNGYEPSDTLPNSSPLTANLGEQNKPSTVDMSILRELQGDMPIKRRPFDQMARRLDIYLEELLARSQKLMELGIIRRYSGVLHHQKAGFISNAMSCWRVPSSDVNTVGRKMVSYPAITHCYERAVNGDWPYNIFAMIHGRVQDECEAVARRISKETGISDYLMLYSAKEFKKERSAWLE